MTKLEKAKKELKILKSGNAGIYNNKLIDLSTLDIPETKKDEYKISIKNITLYWLPLIERVIKENTNDL